jgi:ribonuclease HII
VTVAAVQLPDHYFTAAEPWWSHVTDSKLVSPSKRTELAAKILNCCRVELVWETPAEIDRINILQASLQAMRKALRPFATHAQSVLVDGHLDPYASRFADPTEPRRLGFKEVLPLVKGDQKSVAIAAASIVAKVARDGFMVEMATRYPGYGFEVHKGYPTPMHKAALEALGITPEHRRSFCSKGGPWKEYQSPPSPQFVAP